jgi:hypothetical protein
MCNKAPINAPVNPNQSGTRSSNSGTITANVGNVGGGYYESRNKTKNDGQIGGANVEINPGIPPRMPSYNNLDRDASYKLISANTNNALITFVCGGTIFLLVVLIVSGAVAWYCSNKNNADNSSQPERQRSSSKRRSERHTQRDEESQPLRVYNIPPSYEEVTQNAFQNINQPTSIDVNFHQVATAANTEQVAQPSFNHVWRQPSQPENLTILGPNGKRMVYC